MDMLEDELRLIKIPDHLKEFINPYYIALRKRAAMDLVGESEFRCFKRFIDLSGKYRFATKAMKRLFKFLNLLTYIDEDGKPHSLELYPVQKFMLCGIFGLRHDDGRYLTNTANLYIGRRNGKSFLLSSVLHYLINMSRFRNELIVLASCKGQNATICFNEFTKFIDNDPQLAEVFSSINRTAYRAKSKITGNEMELFRTGGAAKKSLDGYTNKVAVIDEEMLCDSIITKTIQDGQAHFKDSLLVTMSTAQFEIGSDNHKKWLSLRKALYEGTLPDDLFLFLAEPNQGEAMKPEDYENIKVWGKANPVLLFEANGYTIKSYMKKKYSQKAKEAVAKKGFDLQSFATKQCNVWYSAEDRTLCTYDEMKACGVKYSFEDCIKAGYKDWYIGADLSQTLDLSSISFITYVGEGVKGRLIKNGNPSDHARLFVHTVSFMPANKLQNHIEKDGFMYRDYIDTELLLCSGAGGDNIDTQQILDYITKVREDNDLHYVTIAADPYNIAGIQDGLAQQCDTFILQNQSPKSLSQYIEALSAAMKDGVLAYQAGCEDIWEKAVTNAILIRNSTGYYSLEKLSMRADSNIRIDPIDATLTGFIAPYIDFNRREPSSDDVIDEWVDLMGR
jgi:phage terminase large subunit-like protein